MTAHSVLQSDRRLLCRRWREQGWHADSTLGERFAEVAGSHPDVSITFATAESFAVPGAQPPTVTLAELHRRASALAGGLQSLGLRAGDIVVIQAPHSLESAITIQAAMLAGLVVAPVIHIYAEAELSYILAETGARALVVPKSWRKIDFLARVEAVRADCPALEHVIVLGGQTRDGLIAWHDLEERSASFTPPSLDADDLAAVIYTSGTSSGQLKGAQHTHNSLLSQTRTGYSAATAFDPRVPHLSPSPAGHIAGLLVILRAMAAPLSMIVMDSWDTDAALRLCLRLHPAHMNGAPFFYTSLFEAERAAGVENKWPTTYQTGGANVPPTVIEHGERTGRIGWRIYGSSEVPSLAHSDADEDFHGRAHTDGKAGPGDEIRVVDDDYDDVPVGSDGEVIARGPQMFTGYFRRPDLTEACFVPGGWFATGDIGRLDEQGRLTITGRKKDIIIRGGENLSAKEIEDLVATHPAVVEAAAIAVPDERYGERLCAVVRLRPGATLTLDDIRTHFAAAGVAKQKTPEYLAILERPWPRTESGKVRKADLQAMVLAERGDLAD